MNERHTMRPFRKSRLQQLLETVTDSLDLPSGRSGISLPSVSPSDAMKVGLPAKAGLVAGGVVGLTAASAGISSLRRARGGKDDS